MELAYRLVASRGAKSRGDHDDIDDVNDPEDHSDHSHHFNHWDRTPKTSAIFLAVLYPLALLVGVFAVGAGGPFVRIGIEAGMTPLQLAMWRLTLASIALIGWGVVRRAPGPRFDTRDKVLLSVAGVFLALHFLTWMTSLEYVSVARSTLLVSTTPVFAGLLGLFVPSMKPSKEFWIGLAISAVGMVLVTSTATRGPRGTGSFWVGDGMAILGAIAVLPYLLLSQKVQAVHGTTKTVTWIYGAAAVSLWICATFVQQNTAPSNPTAWLAVGGMALFPQMVGHTVFNWSLRHYTAGQVACATLLEPVFAGILAWFLFAEAIAPVQWAGGAVLLAGVAVTLRRTRALGQDARDTHRQDVDATTAER